MSSVVSKVCLWLNRKIVVLLFGFAVFSSGVADAAIAPGLDDYTTIKDAITAAETGDTVELGAGTFYITNTMSIAKGVTLKGAGRDATFLNGSRITTVNTRGMEIDNNGAVLRDLTFCGVTNNIPTTDGILGLGIYLKHGTLDNVRITRIYSDAYRQKQGVGLYMTAGVVTNCVIDFNGGTSRYGSLQGIGVWASGGTIVDSVISDNWRAGKEFYGAGAYLNGAVTLLRCKIMRNRSSGGDNTSNTRGIGICVNSGSAVIEDCEIVSNGIHAVSLGAGTMRNCLVTGHETTATDYTAGVDLSGGNLINCTITGNAAANTFAGLKMTSGTAVNNIIYGNGSLGDVTASGGTFNTNLTGVAVSRGMGNLVGAPRFADAAGGNYSLTLGSPAIDAAAPRTDVTHDLKGIARPQGSASDLGCYEYVAPVGGNLACAVSLDTVRICEGTSLQARAQTAGGDGTAISYQWYLDNQAVAGETSATFAPSSVAAGQHRIHVVVTQSGKSLTSGTSTFSALPRKTYVRADGGNVYPYARVADAARTIADAVDALWSDATATSEIDIGEGTFPITKTIDLSNPIRIVGKGRDQTVINGSTIVGTNVRGAYLGHADSLLKDLTLGGVTNNLYSVNRSGTGINGLGVYLKNGKLENVRITRAYQDAYYQANGTGLYMEAGVVTNCVIDWNCATSRYGAMQGVGVYATGGMIVDSVIADNRRLGSEFYGAGIAIAGNVTVRRCRIVGNDSNGKGNATNNTRGMGVWMSSGDNALVEDCEIVSNGIHAVTVAKGTLRNCLVFGHKTTSVNHTAGLDVSGGRVEHCTVVSNEAPNAFAGLKMTGGTAINNIFWGNGETADALVSGGKFYTNVVGSASSVTTATKAGVINADPKLDGAPVDFRPANGSSAIDAAAPLGLDHDLDGVVRPQRDGYDIGCYEVLPSAEPTVAISAPVTLLAAGGTLSASATLENIEVADATFTWELTGAASETVFGTGAAYASYAHRDSVAGAYALSLTVTYGGRDYAAPDAATFSVKPFATYVSATGDNTFPYDTPEKAAHSVNDAFDAIWQAGDVTTTVHVAAGDYEMTKFVSLGFPVRFVGAGREETRLHGTGIPDSYRAFELASSGAALLDLTVCGVTNNLRSDGIAVKMSRGRLENVRITRNWSKLLDWSLTAVGLKLDGGTVTNCVIDHNSGVSNYGITMGLGVYMTGGLLVDSEIAHNSMVRSELKGMGVYVCGGTIRRCNIHHNNGGLNPSQDDSYGSGLAIEGGMVEDSFITDCTNGVYIADGTLRNSVIARCTSKYGRTGGLWQVGGTVVNCTMAGNISDDMSVADCKMTGGTSKNNIAEHALVSGGTRANNIFNVDPRIRNAQNGRYQLLSGSPAIDAADPKAWTWSDLETAEDVLGNPRVNRYGNGGRLDCGACEHTPHGFIFTIK